MSNRYRIMVGVPSSGMLSEESAQASWLSSLRHDTFRQPSCLSGPNFNNILCMMLEAGHEDKIHLGAMMHVDVTVLEEEPGLRWVDILVEELEKSGADFISVPNAIKGPECLTSSGIGNPENRWNPWRRFTTHNLRKYPTTFTAADIGYGDKFLLHNNALCLFDLRKSIWYQHDAQGRSPFVFNFEEEIRWVDGKPKRYVESEDWYFSRKLWELGVKTAITTRIRLLHHGRMDYANWPEDIGIPGLTWMDDETTAPQWRNERKASA